MADTLLNDPVALRYCILYEVVGNAPIWDAYKSLCKRIGRIDYPEFEFWYMRFANKQNDVHYDRSQDPKSRELLSLPNEVLEMIFNELSFKEKLKMRKVSRDMRDCLQSMRAYIPKVYINVNDKYTSLTYSGDETTEEDLNGSCSTCGDHVRCTNIYYMKENKDCCVSHKRNSKKITREKHLDLALNDLLVFLKNPKFTANYFEVHADKVSCEKINLALDGLSHKVKVKELKLDVKYSTESIPFLPYLDPRTLEKIEIDVSGSNKKTTTKTNILKIAELEQYKTVEDIHWNLKASDGYLVKDLIYCQNLVVNLIEPYSYTKDKVSNKAILDVLKRIFKSKEMKSLKMELFYCHDRVQHTVRKHLSKRWKAVEQGKRSNVYHIPISPKLKRYYVLKLEETKVTVEKKG